MAKLIAKCGGGVNSWALFVLLQRQGRRPDAIVMADPGDEWRDTEEYRDGVGAAWLARVGFPPVTMVSRASEAAFRPRASKVETLFEECDRLASPPSAAYGLKRCSMQYKATPSFWWLQRQPWAIEEHRAGRRIEIAIGYDFGENRHVGRDEFKEKLEAEWCFPSYPLVAAKQDREACEELIRSAGLPVPPKSACMRCPNNKASDWTRLYQTRRDIYDEAVDLSRRSESVITSPAVGFLRGFAPNGKRALHVWHDGGYGSAMPPPPGSGMTIANDDDRDQIQCECSL